MKLAIGCDHGGFELKKEVLAHLKARGIEFEERHKKGDIITYDCLSGDLAGQTITHRVVTDPESRNGTYYFRTQGDREGAPLDDIISRSSKVLKSRGRFIMVHRPTRLAEIFALLRTNHLEPKRMQLVYPFINKAPTMVLIESVKCGGPQLNVEPPLIVYNSDRTYTEQVLRIYGKVK